MRVKFKKAAVKVLTLMLTTFMLMSGISSISPATAKEIKTEDNTATFSAEPSDGVSDKALQKMARNQISPLGEVSPANDANDITGKIAYTTKVYINGKQFAGGDVTAKEKNSYHYSLEWKYTDETASPKNGEYFEIQLFKIPGLNITSLKNQPAIANIDGRNIRLGTWNLTYDNNSGILKFKMIFSEYAESFKRIAGFKEGSGLLSAKGKTDITVNSSKTESITGSLTVENNTNTNPGGINYTGQGWKPSSVPAFNGTNYQFGKGMKWNNSRDNKDVGQIEWRAVYVNYLQQLQKEFLEDNKNILGTDGSGSIPDDKLNQIDKSKLQQTDQYYILEDTLDPNQKFAVPQNDKKYVNAPFFFEAPIIVPGTGTMLTGTGFGNGNYDSTGDSGVTIGADMLKHIDKNSTELNENTEDALEAYVKGHPMTWTIVNVKGSDGLKREKLIINLGKLGAINPKPNTYPLTDGIQLKDNLKSSLLGSINANINTAKNNIDAFTNGTNSPVKELKGKTDSIRTYITNNNISDDAVTAALDEFDAWYTTNYNNSDSLLNAMSDSTLNALKDTGIKEALENLSKSNAQFSTQQSYLDWKVRFDNIKSNQDFYRANRNEYIKKWDYALGRYQLTRAFYENGQLYGFCLKYNTKVVNTSVENYSNAISITTGNETLKTEDNVTIKFNHGITGIFSLGNAVFKKADAAYQGYANAGDNGLAGAQFKVYCAAEETNFIKKLFATDDDSRWKFDASDKYLGVFADKNASVNGNAYVWSHHFEDDQDNNSGIVSNEDGLTELTTDAKGTLALDGLKSNEPHYLVETKAPAGYYLDKTPKLFQTNDNKVLYDFLPNTARAVKLTKASSYTGNPVEGAEFKLYKKNEPADSSNDTATYTEVKGFSKETFTAANGTKTNYYRYNTDITATSAPLKTFANGELNIHLLPAGEYYLQETAPADGYVLTDAQKNKEYHFTLKDEMTEELKGSLYNQNGFSYVLANPDSTGKQAKAVENDEVTKDITFTKVGKENKALTGAAFTLLKWTGTEEEYKNDGGNHEHWVPVDMNNKTSPYFKTPNKGYSNIEKTGYDGYLTNADGKITFTNLPGGHYAIREVKAPDGYELMNHMLYFDVNTADSSSPQLYWNTGSNNPIASNNVPNVLLPGSLKVHKLVVGNNADLSKEFDFTITLKDENEKPLSGTYNYTITRQTGKIEEKVEGKADGDDKLTQETGILTLNSEGQYKFKLTHEDALTVTGLPAGAHYSVKEAEYGDYALTMLNSSGHIASEEVVTVTAQNRYKTGLLRLTKNTTGVNGQKDREFEFTLSLKDESNNPVKGEFAYKGAAAPGVNAPNDGSMKFNENGIAKISLKSGQHITLYGLPDGVNYTISETPTDDYTVKITTDVLSTEENSGNIDTLSETSAIDGNSVSGTISDNKRNDVDFNNISTPDPGELMISKTIECLSIDMNKEFTFDIELKDTNNNAVTGFFPVEINYRDKIDYSSKNSDESKKASLIKREIRFDENGKASVVLKHDEFITIKNLPSDITYTVTERESPGYFSSLKEAATGTISETTPSIVAVTNYHREGNLIVSKQVDGRGGDFNQEFKFDIELNDADGNPLNGNYNYAGSSISSDVTAPANGVLKIRNGKTTFNLKHGQRIVISGLPEGTKYNISEDLSVLGADLKDKYVAGSINSNGTIEDKVASNARFVNRFKTGELRVIKNVVDGDYDKDFNFTVTLDDKNVNGIYNQMKFNNGVAEFTLKHGESKIATGLPAGIKYVVSEDDYDDYIVSSINADGSIEDETISRTQFNNTKKELPPDPGEGGDSPGGNIGTNNPSGGSDTDNPGGGSDTDNPSGNSDTNGTKTGDTFTPLLFVLLTTISAIGIISAVLYRRKTEH